MNNKKLLSNIAILIAMGLMVFSCSKDEEEPAKPSGPGESASVLLSNKVSTPPTIDGTIESVWSNSQKLVTKATVPSAGDDAGNPGSDVFEGVVGDVYNVTMRSVYDDNNIYFLVEYNDVNEDLDRQSWYFDSGSSKWEQENKLPSKPDGNGKWYYEDKFAFQWNINNSVSGWDASTCYSTCHKNIDYASHGNKSARHFTNGAGELTDTWHWKSVRTNFYGQLDDKYFNDDEFGKSGGRHGDTKTGGGYSNNKQDLPVTGGADTLTVPKYVIPGKTGYYWITAADISGGSAKLITGIDVNGVLSYSGGTINPSDEGYEQGTGAKRFPSVTINAFQGGRGDVTAKGVYTGNGWVIEISRALTTPDAGTEDVSFKVTEKYMFGVGVFDNTSIAHAIKTDLELQFK